MFNILHCKKNLSSIHGGIFLVAPPALPIQGSSTRDKAQGQMNVKRINWEKLDQQRVENTVWEQVRTQPGNR